MKTIILPVAICMACCGFAAQVQADAPADQRAESDGPRAVYQRFMRPPGLGRNYDTWADAMGPDVGEAKVDPARLPSRVDNSTRPQFPPIYQQRYGTCGQYAAAATMFTYEMNVLNGTAADSDERRFPATFSWNMMNRATKAGSEAYHGWEVAKRIGLPTVKTYGTVEWTKVGAWPNGYEVWRDAMNYRVSGYRYTPAQTLAQLNEARGWLHDRNQPNADKTVIGGLLAMDGRMGKRKDRHKVKVKVAKGEYAAGEDLWKSWGPTGYGHGITCVGYDDNVGYDLNEDGKITNDVDINGDGKVTLADWERGAYIVANSWGEKWSGDGKIYLLYSAMVDPTWKRGNYFGRVEVARYVPRMALCLKMSCDDRADMRMTIGLSKDADADAPERTIAPEAFNGWPIFGRSGPGNVPLAGPKDETPLEFGVDLTPLVESQGVGKHDSGRVFLRLWRKDRSKATGVVHEAAVRFYDDKGKFIKEQNIAVKDAAFGESACEINAALEQPTE